MNQYRILIIDDEFPMRYLIEHHLRRQGYEVNLAKDGPSGIQAAHANRPDLIVLDAMMPGMDGFEVCAQIRNDPQTAEIPIIFLTALETKEYKSRAYELGADDYLVKPFQSDELMAHITAILRRARRIQTDEFTPDKGHVISLFSPKGGVGTTTLAIQLAEAITMQEDQPVVLMDLDLPLGGIAPILNLYTRQHVVDLLSLPESQINVTSVAQHAQRHRADMLVIPAPGELTGIDTSKLGAKLETVLQLLGTQGHQVILDLGSNFDCLTQEALRLSDTVFVITSGQPVANRLHDKFMAEAEKIGLETRRLMPVINELHGAVKEVMLARVPVARIPHASERSRTRLWLKEQGLRKLVSVALH